MILPLPALLAVIFILGYLAIALEGSLRVQKAAAALILGALLWTIIALGGGPQAIERLPEHLADVAAVIFFLLGAMTIVEVIDSHEGFAVLTSRITTKDTRKLLWIVSFFAFFLSAVLDNLTTTIVMLAIAGKLVPSKKDRLFFAGMIVIAANAGGAFTPIGDVTTTMLWIAGRISALSIIERLFVPSLLNLVVPLIVATFMVGKAGSALTAEEVQAVATRAARTGEARTSRLESTIILVLGVGLLIAVPLFKILTHLPPWVGMLFALGVLWLVTELLHRGKEEETRSSLGPTTALNRIDMSSVMFFIGILLAVSALQSAGILSGLADWLGQRFADTRIVVFFLGLLSAVVDNVPLVAGAIGMYSLSTYPMDNVIWEFLAYTAGTGGSILIIGSAAGVVAMGIENISFGWYLRRIAPLALLGYLAGCGTYILMVH